MKKSVLLFTALSAMGWLTLSSYKDGPGMHGMNYTGGPGSSGTCGQVGCHGNASSTVRVNWADIQEKGTQQSVTSYTPGKVYDVSISTMVIPTPSTQYKLGFQVMSTDATGAQAGTPAVNTTNPGNPVNPGTAHTKNVGGRTILEHSQPIDVMNVGLTITFDWTAPAAGTGPVTFYAMINTANGNGIADAGDIPSFPFSHTISEFGTSVAELDSRIRIGMYPNPAASDVSIEFEDAVTGSYDITVLDLNGRTIGSQQANIAAGYAKVSLPASSWAAGMYLVRIHKDGAQRVLPLVKQ